MTVFSDQTCPACGVAFGLPLAYERSLRANGQSFYCPNGHRLTFGTSAAEKLAEELSRERQRNAQLTEEAEAARREAAAHKGQATRLRNRIQKGVCPCCNRTFTDLQRHMASKHPDQAPAPGNVIPMAKAKG